MSVFPAILTTTAVLIHSVLGCCWHHSHVCDSTHSHTAAVAQEEFHGHTCDGHHHHAPHEDESDDSPPADGPCDGEQPCKGDHSCDDPGCGTTAIVQTNVKSQLDDAMGLVVAVREPVIDAQDSRFTGALSPAVAWHETAEPLRAMMQTWLL